METGIRVMIAGGGTGGHLFPGIAIAEELITRERTNRVLFVGTSMGLEAKILPEKNIPLRTITARGITGKSPLSKMTAFLIIPRALVEALGIIRDFQPHLVIGLGAYVSGPVLAAAWLLGIRRVIQEQNVIPGVTNRLLARLAQRVFVSFEESRRYFPPAKVVVSGNPIRREFTRLDPMKRSEGFGLLVFGGSRGAHRINEAMMEALDHLEDLKRELRIVHVTGFHDAPAVSDTYRRKGFVTRVEPFIEDMVTPYRNSHLVICRAGATTIAELSVCGRASILIPYPFAVNNHQEINARTMAEKGAAKMILDRDLSGAALSRVIRAIRNDPKETEAMESAAARLGKPDAARTIVDECYDMVRHQA